MGIILKSELSGRRTRLVVAGMYLLLLLGAVTMVHPFLVMVSGSFKSKLDQYDFDAFPRFLRDDDLLTRKYLEAKCNESADILKANYRTGASGFTDVPLPDPPPAAQLADWEAFRRGDLPALFYQMGFAAPSQRTVPRNVRAFRAHAGDLCGGDPTAFAARFGTVASHWAQLYVPYENPLARTYQLSHEPLLDAHQDFKRSRPPDERILLSTDGRFARFLAALPRYESDIARYNAIQGTQLAAFEDVTLARQAPADTRLRRDWEEFVRAALNTQYIILDPSARPGFAAFLEHRYGEVRHLSKNYGATHDRFADVPFPADRTYASPALTDYALFLQDTNRLPATAIHVDSPEFRWRDALGAKYGSLEAVRRAHGTAYDSLETIPMPQLAADVAHARVHRRALRREFALRNYRTVVEYLLLYGRGIANTAIYCALSILAALLVNPIAAYALSRYRLPSQYKILLFLMATMTFPPIVTAIPNFLMLKELGLLNTFAALILPGMANGYSIFLLKGFFDSLPRELYEAADIDGASEWQKFWVITMTLSKPILAVIALGAFGAAYGNFMFAFIVCQERSMWTLMVWLYQLQQVAGQEVIFASLVVAALPTLLVFVFCQNLIIRGIVVPTEK